MNTDDKKEILGYVVLGADVDKVEAAKTLMELAKASGDITIIESVEATELITKEEAESINPDLYPIEDYAQVVEAMTKTVIERQTQKAKDHFSALPRRVRRSLMKPGKQKRVLKKLSVQNYVVQK